MPLSAVQAAAESRVMRAPIQKPFIERETDDWTESERELLLRGVAQGDSFTQIAADISHELRWRSAISCKREFDFIRRTVKGNE